MKRREFLRLYFKKFIIALTLVGVIVYTLYHALGNASGSLLTTPARSITDTQILGGEAYLFRSEHLLSAEREGLVNDLVDSGSKVSKGAMITQVWSDDYSDRELANAQRSLDRLNRVISVLENSRVSPDEPLSNALLYKDAADKSFLAIKTALASGNLDDLATIEDDMLIALCRYFGILEDNTKLDQTLAELKEEKNKLLRGTSYNVENNFASGYFYNRSCVDGGEALFTKEALESLTVEAFHALKNEFAAASASKLSVGKMVYDYDWYLAIEIDSSARNLVALDEKYRVVFPENNDFAITLACERLIGGENGRAILVLRSDEIPRNFDYLRAQYVEIEVGQCRGYYVPEQAMVVQGGVSGVYIFENSTVYFKRVDILYRGDGYYIVAEQGDRGDDYLALNDIIVTSGENLYHGKVYQ